MKPAIRFFIILIFFPVYAIKAQSETALLKDYQGQYHYEYRPLFNPVENKLCSPREEAF
jgi:hypothetical protein